MALAACGPRPLEREPHAPDLSLFGSADNRRVLECRDFEIGVGARRKIHV
ncbi:hypothetical protein [Streptomyces geranii]|nr:hypothetical protein [Streptomyces geranii]